MAENKKSDRDRQVSRVLWTVLWLNVGVALLKLGFGFQASAVSMLADGLHSLLDGASNVVGLVAMKIAASPPDDDHPYGHRKFEAVASLLISMFLFLTATEVLREVVGRMSGDHEVDPSPLTFAAMVLTLIVNIFVTRYERRRGAELRSSVLEADSKHTQSDVFVSIGVLASLVAAELGFAVLDIVVAVVIVGFIGYSGYEIIRSSFTVLTDSQVVDPGQVASLAMGIPGVTYAHHIRSRGVANDVHVDLHIHVPGDMTTADSHDLAHDVVERIKSRVDGVTDVVVHVEPEGHHADP